MHATQLVEIAGWAAFNARELIYGPASLPATTCNEYWSQSKCRQNRWMTALKMFERDIQSSNPTHDPWPAIEIVTQEIFLSELLTRVWSAVMVTHDEYHDVNEFSGIAHSIHIGHIEAKNRAMRLLLDDQTIPAESFDRLNGLRRKVERWTDLLLGQLPDVDTAARFAFQPNRVRDFSEENLDSNHQAEGTRRLLITASMNEEFNRATVEYSANPAINRRIASGLMAFFPADRFDSYGLPKSIQMIWLEKATDDTQLLFDDLAALDQSALAQSLDDFDRSV